MPQKTDIFELERLGLRSGEGRRLDLHVSLPGLSFGGQRYDVRPDPVPVRLDVSRTTGQGYALRLRFEAQVNGPCMRCLDGAEPAFAVDSREINQPRGGDEMRSPYVDEAAELDLLAWARDALALTVPDKITCRPECAGLCAVCGQNLNEAPDHAHEVPPDPRWAKLRELRLE